ncbi:hypothetical protein [Streptomyces sp. H23]|uniref:hypothetical protein n=1 Tax=Streptomyces sp. H23 TaxID=2541723 RepID=UPI00106E7468|nr:hypothetical protein [Streptomyces sp. H23]
MLKTEAAVDGCYSPLTSVLADQADAGQALIHCKGQDGVERRCHNFKGPLAVTPLFVQHNWRVAALIKVVCLPLLVFCLIKLWVRRALGPEQSMSGLCPGNRRVRSSSRMNFYHPGRTHLRIGNVTAPIVRMGRPTPPPRPIRQTRWPQTWPVTREVRVKPPDGTPLWRVGGPSLLWYVVYRFNHRPKETHGHSDRYERTKGSE